VVEILEYVAIELLGIVNNYLSGYSKMTYYILLEESLKPCCCYID
jgi:hypothetical protein